MKQLDRVASRDENQLERAIRITRGVKKQFFIILALSSAALLTAIFGTVPTVRASYPPIADLLLGLSGNLFVAVIIFLFLEQGIKSLHPISEIRNLPTTEFIGSVRLAKKGDRIRILETSSSLINEHYAEFASAITKAIREGAEVEILLFHPYSQGARRRAEQLKGRANVPESIRKNLAHLYEVQSITEHDIQKSIQVKLYSARHPFKCTDAAIGHM